MMLWRGERPLVLASQSRSRGMLLSNAGLAFEAIPAHIDERGIQQASGLTGAGEVAGLLAREKALAVSAQCLDRIVIGADQTLACGPRLFEKPSGRAAAADQLRALSGSVHELHAAFAVTKNEEILTEQVAVARMKMRRLSDAQIETYLSYAGDAVTSSVGAYQLEGLGVHLFEAIEGDHFTILGLPLLPLLAFLREQGLVAL
ncbi:MAG TPA: Maf family protein [Xanthobacteraceae bacterium]|nr:Maf family protein [Xanthobacteraceae bacterium]